jgi:hypothetical protein
MRMIVLVCSLIALALPLHAAQLEAKAQDASSMEKRCRALVGREATEGTGQDSHVGQLQVQRFSDCMMGRVPRV